MWRESKPYTEKAAAIRYDGSKESAPKVIAKGSGELAKKIIQKAQEFDVPLFQNALLVDSLLELQIDEKIPPRLYKAVVEVFVWLAKTEQSASAKK